MNYTFLAEDIRKISDKLNKIYETAEKINDNPKDKTDSEKTDPEIEDISTDNTVTDLMTHEKTPAPLTGSIRIEELAQLLGIKNTRLFRSAFNNLRSGKLPSNTSELRELAIAFDKLLAADSSTTGKVLNQLRRIHKAT